MSIYSFHSARATFRAAGRDVLEVVYTGVVSDDAVQGLVPPVLQALDGEQVFVARMDTAVTLLQGRPAPPAGAYRPGGAAAAIVVRRDQLAVWGEYVQAVREIGLRRVIFLSDEVEMARRWAWRHRYLELARAQGV
jgi:hypothetical protein